MRYSYLIGLFRSRKMVLARLFEVGQTREGLIRPDSIFGEPIEGGNQGAKEAPQPTTAILTTNLKLSNKFLQLAQLTESIRERESLQKLELWNIVPIRDF